MFECVKRFLTLNLLTTTIVAPPSNASKWQMGFNSAFKGLMSIAKIAHRIKEARRMVIVPAAWKLNGFSHITSSCVFLSRLQCSSEGHLHVCVHTPVDTKMDRGVPAIEIK